MANHGGGTEANDVMNVDTTANEHDTEPQDEETGDAEQIRRKDLAFVHQLPTFNAAYAMANLHGGETGIDVFTMRDLLAEQSRVASSGNLDRLEAMLTTSAHVLNSVFTKYVGMAATAEYVNGLQTYMSIAMKAQNQCRQTISVLGELKSPKRATFIKQQNNNAVNQQINQAEQPEAVESDSGDPELLEKIPSESNELLETKIERMDERTPAKTK
jgi:hypothetical protein